MARTAARASDWARVVVASWVGLVEVMVVVAGMATLVFVVAEVEDGGVIVVGAEEDFDVDAELEVEAMVDSFDLAGCVFLYLPRGDVRCWRVV